MVVVSFIDRAPERGFALPALVLALLGGSVLLMALPGVDPGHRERDRRPLLQARLALLAHVSAYPESYGPLGAGPGHLPCPDTDASGWRQPGVPSRDAGTSAPFSGDGPDPPCGGAALAIGHLPRHVSLPGRRELFHAEDAQLWWYVVSADWVNNPARAGFAERSGAPGDVPGDVAGGVAGGAPGRVPGGATRPRLVAAIVDPGVLSSRERHERLEAARGASRVEDALARLQGVDTVRVDESGLATRQRSRRAGVTSVVLTRAAVHRAASQRVVAWLHERAQASLAIMQTCIQFTIAEPDLPARHWLVDVDPAAPCQAVRETALDEIGQDAVLIEQVPAARHWFVRGGWHRRAPRVSRSAS